MPQNSAQSRSKEFDVEFIKEHRLLSGKPTHYLIKWKNYPDDQCTWEPESNLNCPTMLQAYWRNQTMRKSKSSTLSPEKKKRSPSRSPTMSPPKRLRPGRPQGKSSSTPRNHPKTFTGISRLTPQEKSTTPEPLEVITVKSLKTATEAKKLNLSSVSSDKSSTKPFSSTSPISHSASLKEPFKDIDDPQNNDSDVEEWIGSDIMEVTLITGKKFSGIWGTGEGGELDFMIPAKDVMYTDNFKNLAERILSLEPEDNSKGVCCSCRCHASA